MIVQPDFLDHWKTRRLIQLLDYPAAPLCLIRLWIHCQCRRTARHKLDPQVLASICNYQRSEPEQLWNALIETRFVEQDGEYLIVHDWEATNASLIGRWKGGKTTKSRYSAKAKPKLSKGKAKAKPKLSPGSAKAKPQLSQGDKSREEKSREEEEHRSTSEIRSTPSVGEAVQKEKSALSSQTEIVQHAEAQTGLRLAAKVRFNEPIAVWGQKAQYDYWLNEALPIPRPEFEAMKWLYSLEDDDEIFTNRQHPAYTQRRQSFMALLQNLRAECQKAFLVQKKYVAVLGNIEAIPE